MDALKTIATIRSDFTTKFGIPRQSGLAAAQLSTIVFESEYRDENALRGLDGYSHIWLIWGFSEVKAERWSPMVKPPRLGGNKRMGVFATRSPYRPNPIGLSSVKLEGIEKRPNLGTVLIVLVLWYGGTLIFSKHSPIDAPTFIFYMVILYSIIQPLKDFAKASYNIPKGMASVERVNKILNAANPISEASDAKEIKGLKDEISFNDVHFAYKNGGEVLQDKERTNHSYCGAERIGKVHTR